MTNTIKEIIGKYKGDFIRIRQRIHKNPELGAKEFETQKFIIDELNKHGIKNYKCAETGVVGLIEGKNHESKEAKTILLRADMDALPINETTNAEFSSINPNVMHACGHDGHVANLLIAAFVLNDLKDKFYGNIKLMFQPAEESIGGCERMIKEGILKDPKVDYAVGLHVDADSDEGVITTKPGE
jgi:amidohydrolase